MARQTFQYHPTIGHTFIPGVRARLEHEGGGYLIRVNDQGFRSDHQFEAAKPPGVFRVLLFGDSFPAGDGVSNRYRFSEILEELVPDIEVYNFGLPGTGTDQHYLTFREFASGIDHDLVIHCGWVENIERNAARFKVWGLSTGDATVLAKPYFRVTADGALELHHVPVPKDPIPPEQIPEGERPYTGMRQAPAGYAASRNGNEQAEEQAPAPAPRRRGTPRGRLGRLVRTAVRRAGPRAWFLAKRLRRGRLLPAYASPDSDGWRLTRGIFERWSAELSAPLLVVPVPLPEHLDGIASPRAYQDRFGELTELSRVHVHDPLPELRAYDDATRRGFRFETDPHFTRDGHRAFAEALAPAIRAHIEARVATA